uniref:Reverse transcriptase domain-containing protein n=1 Tax=Cyprinus carpio TaxID=7962 RepID=A0A8C1G451_CYPCA
IAVRSNPNVKGVIAGQQEHKILLYDDDILLISRNPQITVPTMCPLIDDFSQISGYKINWSKSEVMPLSKNHNNMLEVQWPFKWVSSGLVHLGIKLVPGLEKIMQVNFQPVIQETQNLLQNWSKLTMSILGRINLVKMINVLKINYLSYMLPLALPLSLLKEYNKNVESFICQVKKPLFNRTKLYSAKSLGGLSLPRVDWYHWSFSLSQWTKINMVNEL